MTARPGTPGLGGADDGTGDEDPRWNLMSCMRGGVGAVDLVLRVPGVLKLRMGISFVFCPCRVEWPQLKPVWLVGARWRVTQVPDDFKERTP